MLKSYWFALLASLVIAIALITQASLEKEIIEETISKDSLKIPATGSSSLSIQSIDIRNERGFDQQQSLIRGIFSPDLMSFTVIQQPSGQTSYVSEEPEIVTQFQLADLFNMIGLLAHDHLAGGSFFQLKIGDSIWVFFEDGAMRRHEVVAIKEFHAKEPNNISSQFIDLDTGLELSAEDVFLMVYSGDHHLTLQVSIRRGNVEAWGRRFILAELR